MWMNQRYDPVGLAFYPEHLAQRIDLYKRFFPEQQVKYECSCAIDESNTYHNDKIFKDRKD
jgi:hypothetical protein